jgi:hypothetical protein
MKRIVVGLTLMTLMAVEAEARVRHGAFFGPRWAPYRGLGLYGGWGPGWGWGGYGPYHTAGPSAGRIKIETGVKDAEVLIDGGFAGTVSSLKTLSMRPGAYSIELRAPGRNRYAERVYVVAGKTVTLRPDLAIKP